MRARRKKLNLGWPIHLCWGDGPADGLLYRAIDAHTKLPSTPAKLGTSGLYWSLRNRSRDVIRLIKQSIE